MDVKSAAAFVQSISPKSINPGIFWLLPKPQQADRLRAILKKLASVEVAELPVVKTAQEIVAPRMSVSQKLKMEYHKLDFDVLPQRLQLLVINRYSAKEKAVVCHAEIHKATTDEERLAATLACVEHMADNWDIWEELDHFAKKGVMLGKHEDIKLDEFQKEIDSILMNNNPLQVATALLGKMRTAENRIYSLKKNEGTQKTIDKWVSRYDFLAEKLQKKKWNDR